MAPDVAPQAGESPKLLLKATETGEVETEIQWKELTAPIRKGDVIGTLVYSLGGETLAQVEITAGEDVEEVTFSSALGYLMRALITL